MVSAIVYPQAKQMNHVDDYHGTPVADPYRWLEDPHSEDTRAWITAENEVTEQYLSGVARESQLVKRRLTKIWDYEKCGSPVKKGDRVFYYKNDGLQNHSVLYVVDQPGAEARVLLDPNELSADGSISLSSTAIDTDGNLLAYGLSRSGSDWQEWHVRDINTGQDLPDIIHWVKFSKAVWRKDGKGFFYSRFDEPNDQTKHEDANYGHKLYYHRIGTAQSEDVLIYHRPDKKNWLLGCRVTEEGRYLLIAVDTKEANANLLFYKDLSCDDSPIVELFNKNDAHYSCVGNDGTLFWFETDLAAPRGRLISIDIAESTADNLKITEVIPQAAETLEGISFIGNRFFAFYLQDAHTQIKEFSLDGKFTKEIPLPGIGSAGGFGGKQGDMETYYTFSGYTTPATIYHYDIASGKSTVYFKPNLSFDTSKYITKLVFYKSKDGTRIPLYITYRKGLKRNGKNATYLYGYGGFSISQTPSFSINLIPWMDMGGIFAVACIRGGGEYGEEWHQSGTKLRKQNVFDDFIAAAEWLIENNYTSSAKLAIGGGSNGGLLVGACMNQRPELFGAACPSVGVMDMLRFHKFTIGSAWRRDYGCADNPEEFRALYAYSPLHNIKAGTHYPATYVTTADHDDRVVPAHSFKFTATLQAAQAGAAPCLIKIETKAGHGAGKPTTQIIESCAVKWAFLAKVLQIPSHKLESLKS